VNNYKQYINRAKELGMTAFAFTEHGSILEWLHKKEYCEKIEFVCETCGEKINKRIEQCPKCNSTNLKQTIFPIKYIHGIEIYVTKSLEEKIRDNYHTVLLAKNYEGFKEINKLVSKSFNRANIKNVDDIERFYYSPRITFDELIHTSDNVIVTTACLASILNSSDDELVDNYLNFLKENKHRCFLEIQHHNVEEQIKYNQRLWEYSKQFGLLLSAGTDTHILNKEYVKARLILQKAKKTHFENEDDWDLTLKSYDELVEAYKEQNSLPYNVYMEAIENTNLIAGMVEEFEVDTSYKYPTFSSKPKDDLYRLAEDGIKWRGVDDTKELRNRIKYEIDTYEHNGASNLLLLEHELKQWARENNVHYGDSRGSVSGSMVAYLMGITNVNSMKHNLNFERFMNKERVSLADIDTDWSPSQRDLVKQFLYDNPKYYCCEIITFNTIALKGAIRDVGRALEIPLKTVDEISKSIETSETKYRKEYPELFEYVDQLQGVIVSMGSHPAATVCSPIPLDDSIGLITLSTNNFPVSMLNMKEVDSLNFVKLDILGLDNIEIIANTCELAGIPILNADNVDDKDEKVWEDMLKHPIGIFQFEGDYAHRYLRDVFRPEVIEKIKVKNPDLNYIDLMSMANGAIRPAGDSYRNALSNGEFRDNGHEALNDLLKATLGYCVYQESIIEFLNKFCGYTMGMADVVRRGFAKKTGTEKYIPKIKSGFIKTMLGQYNTPKNKSEEIIKSFLQIIEDASDYLFSENHALPYSYIGYICAWLRYYCPIEFFTTLLNVNANNIDKTNRIIDYLRSYTKITIKAVKFRKSRSKYFFDKQSNQIYRGIGSIKNFSGALGENLYELKNNQYDTFVDLLIDLEERGWLGVRIGDLILIKYFEEFGGNKKLLQIYEEFNKGKNRYERKHTQKTKDKRIVLLKEYEASLPNESLPIHAQINADREILGYIQATYNVSERYVYVMDINTKFAPRIEIYCLASGKTASVKMYNRDYNRTPFCIGDVLYCEHFKKENAKKFVSEGVYEDIEGQYVYWLDQFKIIHNFDEVHK
jgi:DNA polymerase-3 subunit alpha